MYYEVTSHMTGEVVNIVYSETGATIPTDPANADYAAYLEWVSQGNTPEPWQPNEPQEVV